MIVVFLLWKRFWWSEILEEGAGTVDSSRSVKQGTSNLSPIVLPMSCTKC